MSIRNKIIGAFIVLIALSLFTSVFTSFNINHIKDNVDELDQKDFAGITFLLEADRDSYQSNLALLQIMNSSQDIDKRIEKGC